MTVKAFHRRIGLGARVIDRLRNLGFAVQICLGFGDGSGTVRFAAATGCRWQPGTSDLPAHVLGHIGQALVPWKRGRGYAKRALAMLLPEPRATGLPFIELISDPENTASQAVILASGGQLIEGFQKPASYGTKEALRFRLTL